MPSEEPPQDSLPEAAGSLPDSSLRVLQRLQGQSSSRSYKLEGEVARGAMGAILKVWDDKLHRPLAMKVILGSQAEAAPATSAAIGPKALGRFLEEAQVTGQLDHPGIVPVHDLGLDEQGRVYFTMRLVRGRDLKEVFDLVHKNDERWTTARALGVMLKVCEAMAYAHDKGVIHRDLKPSNVMVGRFGEVYVMDWGLARVLGKEDMHDVRLRDDSGPIDVKNVQRRGSVDIDASESGILTMDGDIVGTPVYMSPEQARGNVSKLDRRSDVYAAGAMLYHLLSGEMPFMHGEEKVSQLSVLMKLIEGPPVPLATVQPKTPPELVAITEKAMARKPEDRYPDMQALAEDLRAFLEQRVVRAYEAGPFAEIRMWVVRNKPLAIASAAAVLALIVGLITSSALYVKAEDNATLAENRRIEAQDNERRAKQNEVLALAREAEADRERERVLRLSDAKRLDGLEADARELWPADPERADDFRAWIDRAEVLEHRLEEHKTSLEEIRERAQRGGGGAAGDERYEFLATEDQWHHDVLAELVGRLEEFTAEKTGLLANVRRRLEFAESVEERTLTGDDARALWAEAVASIASREECPMYDGLEIVPQLGLLPVGRDPASGLWEFVHVQSGAVPQRTDEGLLAITEASGIVLVLLPGGTFFMGAQSDYEEEINFDELATNNEYPVHEVELDPFFVSKCEMTQAQWARFTQTNPSAYKPGTAILTGVVNGLHPIENVSWVECERTLAHMGLELPTEAQWEYAARGDSFSAWWPGDSREDLRGVANIADQSAARAGGNWTSIQDWPELDDGFPIHAPVGSLRANGFGLHDVHGNVVEWCRDWFGAYQLPFDYGNGLRSVSNAAYRIYRGGCFQQTAADARCAAREAGTPTFRGSKLGVRPARRLEL